MELEFIPSSKQCRRETLTINCKGVISFKKHARLFLKLECGKKYKIAFEPNSQQKKLFFIETDDYARKVNVTKSSAFLNIRQELMYLGINNSCFADYFQFEHPEYGKGFYIQILNK